MLQTAVKQTFQPGDNWFYMKLYMGPATMEQWIALVLPKLIEALRPAVSDLQFFYIRYRDPHYHLRLRIFEGDLLDIQRITQTLSFLSKQYIDESLIWTREICPYERELDRYQPDIEVFEKAFYFDTICWMQIIKNIHIGDYHENNRWIPAFLSINAYLQLLNTDGKRLDFLSWIADSFRIEFEAGRTLKAQVDRKYRIMEQQIASIFQSCVSGNQQIDSYLGRRDTEIRELFLPYMESDPDYLLQNGGQGLAGLIHMSLNRGLRSRHREQELVLYDFMVRQLKSQIARE